ncbi:hypothetical protein [Kallotenue papyrolyticum]|uniref:hypothetical protein n=1 Tax=Kallotenue papyrolyticum TaxID=1325125 RepID=UPI00047069EC|nr:hypothetical protein [Kallotenue papyrolyticum]
MSQLLRTSETPPARELLARAAWADLDRLAARHGIVLAGRRRDLALERLQTIYTQPERLRAAAGVLSEHGRALLRLLLLLGSVEDERELALARERWLAVAPDAALQSAHLGSELATLQALGLLIADRRRLVVPAEVLAALSLELPPAAPPTTAPRSYAELRLTLQRLLTALATDEPSGASTPRRFDRLTAYRPRAMPADAATALAGQLGLDADELLWWLPLLEELGAATLVRGRWQVGEAWSSLQAQPPRTLLTALLDAWLRPRSASDLSGTGCVWVGAPDVEVAAVVAAHEARVRGIIWRWLRDARGEAVARETLITALLALHPWLAPPADAPAWIALEGTSLAEPAPAQAVAEALVAAATRQLSWLGLVVADEQGLALTPLARWLDGAAAPVSDAPAVHGADAALLLVDPLRVDAELLALIQQAAELEDAVGERLRYRLTPAGLARLEAAGHSIAAFEARLRAAQARLEPAFTERLADWAARVGRLRLHAPLSVLLTGADVPLAGVLQAAGLSDRALLLGPGCALIEPESVEAAVEQLRARGFWPVVEQ